MGSVCKGPCKRGLSGLHSPLSLWVWALLVFIDIWVFLGGGVVISQVQVLKVGVLNVRHERSAPLGEVQGCQFPPDHWSRCWGYGLWGDCVSVFPTPSMRCFPLSAHLLLGFFPTGKCSIYSCRLVCPWEEGSSGFSYVAISNGNPYHTL